MDCPINVEVNLLKKNGVINLHETKLYHYLMTLKGPAKDSETDFANEAAKDIQFPKQTEDYHELSSYLEMNADYLSNMDIFDELWEKYLENNNKSRGKANKSFSSFFSFML